MGDLFEQVKEKALELWNNIQESSAFNTLMEKYQNLSHRAQKGVIFGFSLLGFLIVMSLPYSFFSSSMDNVASFEEDRQLIRKLLRASRVEAPTGSLGMKRGSAQARANTVINSMGLVKEQDLRTRALRKDEFQGSLSKPPIVEEGFEISIKKLNLNQVLQAGYLLQSLGQGSTLAGMDMVANAEDNHYYDVLFQVMTYSLPEEPVEEEKSTKGKRRSKRKRGGN